MLSPIDLISRCIYVHISFWSPLCCTHDGPWHCRRLPRLKRRRERAPKCIYGVFYPNFCCVLLRREGFPRCGESRIWRLKVLVINKTIRLCYLAPPIALKPPSIHFYPTFSVPLTAPTPPTASSRTLCSLRSSLKTRSRAGSIRDIESYHIQKIATLEPGHGPHSANDSQHTLGSRIESPQTTPQ